MPGLVDTHRRPAISGEKWRKNVWGAGQKEGCGKDLEEGGETAVEM